MIYTKQLFSFIIILTISLMSMAQSSDTVQRMAALGWKNIAEADGDIVIDLMYAKTDNFTGKILYEDFNEAYLHPDALQGLLRAQQALKKIYPDYNLIVYDAGRPMSVQQQMWNVVRGTSLRIYVGNPANGGGMHNYGLAVDVSILDKSGVPLPMGTSVDHLGEESHITNEAELLRSGKLTQKELENRQLLRQVMRKGGYRTLHSEWWHYNWCTRQEAKERYVVLP